MQGTMQEAIKFICENTEADVTRRKILIKKLMRIMKQTGDDSFEAVRINPYHFMVQGIGSNSVLDIQTARWKMNTSKHILYAKLQKGGWSFDATGNRTRKKEIEEAEESEDEDSEEEEDSEDDEEDQE